MNENDLTRKVADISARWSSAEGTLTPTVAPTNCDDDTGLEYRGALGKFTLATVHATEPGGDGLPWVERFARAAADVRWLLDAILQRDARTAEQERADVVAWMERQHKPNAESWPTPWELSEAVERGEHVGAADAKGSPTR